MGALQGALRSPAAVAGAAPVAADVDSAGAAAPNRGPVPFYATSSADVLVELMLPANAKEDEVTEVLSVLDELGLMIGAGGRGSARQLDWPRLHEMIAVDFSFFTTLSTLAFKGMSGHGIDIWRVFAMLDDAGVPGVSLTDDTVRAIGLLPVFSGTWTVDQVQECSSIDMGSLLVLVAAVNDTTFLFDDTREANPLRCTSVRKGVEFLLLHRAEIQVRAVR
jgi:hypothetical protein